MKKFKVKRVVIKNYILKHTNIEKFKNKRLTQTRTHKPK
jgi:hypothetical protein